MATIVKPYTFSASAAAYAEHVNANFDQAYACVNGDLDLTNLLDDSFVTSFQFHRDGLIPASTGLPAAFTFTWPTINTTGGTVELTISEIGIAFSNTTGGGAVTGIARVELYELTALGVYNSMDGRADATAKFTPGTDTSFGVGFTTLHAGKTYALSIKSVVDGGNESNAHDVDVWLEGRTQLFERYTGA